MKCGIRPPIVLAGLLAMVSLVCLTGCPLTCPTQATVNLAASPTALNVGDTVTVTATSTDPADTAYDWQVDDNAFAISAKLAGGNSIIVTAVNAGACVITAKGANSGQTGFIKITAAAVELPETFSHAGKFTMYEGSKTCMGCHAGIAEDVHASLHYQWDGETPYAINGDGGGKMAGMNGFCTSPSINFIGILTNLDGQKVSGGCAQCHVGMGATPSLTPTDDQLENIDCLVCHSKNWRRKVAKLDDGSFVFIADEAAMPVPLIEAITDISRVDNATCIKCHAYAGGGQNNKRGDIEASHYNPSRDFDVHMASHANGGAGLYCIDCHTVDRHRFAGRGSDTRVTDLDEKVSCDKCHGAAPHSDATLNRHFGRVDCTVCHIPKFSRGSTTEMYRDFSVPEVHEDKRLWEPTLTRQGNVIPAYRFFDGTSFVYTLHETAMVDTFTGNISNSVPVGDVKTPGAKIHAFKLHVAYQPIDIETDVLIPLKMGIYFQTANVAGSITTGASQAGIALNQGYEYVETERWMGIFHEVAPKENALRCGDCHGENGRMDFDALGYTPNSSLVDRPLCASCHEDKGNVWDAEEYFYELHTLHAEEKGFDCAVCHGFNRAQ